METRPANKTPVQVIRVSATERPHASRRDFVATEEPLEIRLVNGQAVQQVAITMRTPGADFELAAGFLFAEGIITDRAAIRSIRYCVDSTLTEAQHYNVVNVVLRETIALDWRSLERHFVVSSACGVCGKTSIDVVMSRMVAPLAGNMVVPPQVITGLSQTLRDAQRLFAATGGLHAAALFDSDGRLLTLREDVGRHNALDKLVGWALLHDLLPLSECILLVSGRASFELVQKAAVAGISVLCAISAPSSMAVSLARKSGMTLIGFLRDEQFNLYCGETRIQTG